MKTGAYFALAVVLLAPGAAFCADARTEYYQRAAERDTAMFGALDRDNDRSVTRLEAHGDLNFGPRFDDMDTNRDGTVTADELRRYIDELKASGYTVLEHEVALQRKFAFPLVPES